MKFRFRLPFYTGPTEKYTYSKKDIQQNKHVLIPLEAEYSDTYDYIQITNFSEFSNKLWDSYTQESGNMASTPLGKSSISSLRLEQFTKLLDEIVNSCDLNPGNAIDIGGGEGAFLLNILNKYNLPKNKCAIIEPATGS